MFCTTNGVSHPPGPPSRRVMFGRYTLDAPVDAPLYAIHDAPCPSMTVALTAPPAAACTTSENCVSFGNSPYASGFSIQACPALSCGVVIVATDAPSLKRYAVTVAVVAIVPTFWIATGVVQPCGPPNVFVTFGKKICPVAARACAPPRYQSGAQNSATSATRSQSARRSVFTC